MGLRLLAIAGAIALVAPPVAASRTLDVLPSVTWKHAGTGLTMGPYLGSLPRNEVGDYGTEEKDLFLQYRGSDGTVASIFLFHPGLKSVPMWFDRVLAQIKAHKDLGEEGEATPQAFAVRAGGPATGLRITYPMHGAHITATAAAVVSVADWLVVVRLSSPKLEAPALDAEMSAILKDIGWPADKMEGPVAVPVEPCATLPTFKQAKLIKPDMQQAIIGSLLAEAPREEGDLPIPTYCRAQQEPGGAWGVYRAAGEERGYVMALADAGRAIKVEPSLAALVHKKRSGALSVNYFDLSRRQTYPDVTEQLPPEQALDIINHVTPLATVTYNGTGDTSISINSDAVGKK